MLFFVEKNSLRPVPYKWDIKELELEKFLVTSEDGNTFLSEEIFGDRLLVLSNQVRTRANKRADIFAIDQNGNGVIIELKRDHAPLGVDTQALQYLADFSRLRGNTLLQAYPEKKNSILSHVGATSEEDLNRFSRIILVAQSFDETLFSMGEWLSSKGVGFRLVEFYPVEIESHKLLSFSVRFDRSSESLYRLGQTERRSTLRRPGIFWHNIGESENAWWRQLVRDQQIATSFDNEPGDAGEALLKSYLPGDKIVAFAKGKGAIGWGEVIGKKYQLLKAGEPGSRKDGLFGHRLDVHWKHVAVSLDEGIPVTKIREELGVYHPLSTSVSIDSHKGNRLIEKLSSHLPKCE